MRKVKDFYYKKAKQDKYPARSIYKLEEAQKKYHFLHRGDSVLDLGCCPGSWSLYASETIGETGTYNNREANGITGNHSIFQSMNNGWFRHLEPNGLLIITKTGEHGKTSRLQPPDQKIYFLLLLPASASSRISVITVR